MRFFQGFAIVLALTFLLAGGSLFHESIGHPGQPWGLLGGALFCSLTLMLAYFLWKQRASGKYL